MKQYRLTDSNGEEFVYDGSDMRMVLVVHHQLYGTEAVKVEEEQL